MIGAILKDQPTPLGTSQPLAPPFLDRVVRKCLAKDPNGRWQSAGDLRDELQWVGDVRIESATVPAHPRTAGARTRLLAGVAVLAIAVGIALGATAAMRFGSAPREVPETRLQIVTALPFVQTPFDDSQGQFSPDGRWVAYQSNESGRFEINVVPFPRPNAKFQISTGGGSQPRWRRDGRELFYMAPDGKLMAVAIRTGPSIFQAETPVPLFQTRIPGGYAVIKQQYAVATDGRFLVNNATEESAASPINIVQNWKQPQSR